MTKKMLTIINCERPGINTSNTSQVYIPTLHPRTASLYGRLVPLWYVLVDLSSETAWKPTCDRKRDMSNPLEDYVTNVI